MQVPPEGFIWHLPDAGELLCTQCDEIVRAEVCDLHMRFECDR